MSKLKLIRRSSYEASPVYRWLVMKLKPALLPAMFIALTSVCFAQKTDNPIPGEAKAEKMEKLESMKIAFFTEQLNLTPEEATKFWPVYNAYHDEMEKLRKEHREALLNAKDNFEKLSDKDIEKLVDNEVIFRQSELDVLKKYSVQFKQVLPIRKVARLYRAEEQWKKKILDMWREKRESH